MRLRDLSRDPDFINAPDEQKHAYLMAMDPAYAAGAPEQQAAYRASFKPAGPTWGNKVFDVINWPMKKALQGAGALDVYAGNKTQDQADRNSDVASRLLTTLGLTVGAGGLSQGLAARMGASPMTQGIAAGGARAVTQGGLDALQAPKGRALQEFSKGAGTSALSDVGAGVLTGTAKKLSHGLINVNVGGGTPANPNLGDAWRKDYFYGLPPGAPPGMEPVLLNDRLRYIGGHPPAPTPMTNFTRGATSTGVDALRKVLFNDQGAAE